MPGAPRPEPSPMFLGDRPVGYVKGCPRRLVGWVERRFAAGGPPRASALAVDAILSKSDNVLVHSLFDTERQGSRPCPPRFPIDRHRTLRAACLSSSRRDGDARGSATS